MLKKLLKYEFKATARTYGGMYLALLAASVLFGGSVRRWNGTNNGAYSTLVGLLSLVYTAVIIGTVVVTIMTIVQRFYRNLLGREPAQSLCILGCNLGKPGDRDSDSFSDPRTFF